MERSKPSIPWRSKTFRKWSEMSAFVDCMPIGTIYEYEQVEVVPETEYVLRYYRACYRELSEWGYIKN
jgi:hypothetical protein